MRYTSRLKVHGISRKHPVDPLLDTGTEIHCLEVRSCGAVHTEKGMVLLIS